MRPRKESLQQVVHRSYSDSTRATAASRTHPIVTQKDSTSSRTSIESGKDDLTPPPYHQQTPVSPIMQPERPRSFSLTTFPINSTSFIFRKMSRDYGGGSGCKLLEETEDGLNQPFNNAEVPLEFPKDTFKRREITRFLRERHERRHAFSCEDSDAIVKLLKSRK